MKVLQIIPTLYSGGAERFVTDLSLALSDDVTIEVATLFDCEDEYYVQKLKSKKVIYRSFGKKLGFDLKCFFRMFEFIKNCDYDVIHCHIDSLKYVALPCLMFKKNLVYTLHNLADKDCDSRFKFLYKFVLKSKIVTPVAICETVKQSAIDYYGNYFKNIPVIYNGIDLSEINSISVSQNNEKKYTDFLCVATFKEQKNHFYLIDLFEKISTNMVDSRLFLVGTGELLDKVKEYVLLKKIENKVFFLGNRTDVYKLMKKSDVFILASKYEGFSIAILEAMACGMRVIASDVGGNSEQIVNMYNGMIFDLNRPEDVINKIELFLKKDYIKENAYDTVSRNFDISIIKNNYIDLYTQYNN